MEKIELTKNTIKKFYDTPIEVNLWNGCFNKAEVNVTNNRKYYRLEVYVTHPLLHWQCGDKNEVNIICHGYVHSQEQIPNELDDLIVKMKELATMSTAEAFALSQRNKSAFRESLEELGLI